jgi:uncharacterized membrane protein
MSFTLIPPNDWRLKKCLLVCGGITALQVAITLIMQAGLELPVIHQATGFIFLTLVPGMLLLRILRIHQINTIESIAYSVGLSLALIMLSGTLINFAFPIINISRPLTLYPLMLTMLVEIIILMTIAWFRDRNWVKPDTAQFKLTIEWNAILFLLIIFLLIILGVQVRDLTNNNIIIIVSLLLIALTMGLAAFKKLIKPMLYTYALFIISLGILYQTTLMSPYLIGSDIISEYMHYSNAASSGIWNYALPNPVNSCLSIVILAPAYSYIMNISGIWVFKAVYPLLFSIVPLILFRFFRIQIGIVPAFAAVFFFIAVPTFSLEMISLCRQQIAEIFFALIVLLLVERKLTVGQKFTTLTVFSVSVIVSHYSLGFITAGYLLLLLPAIAILRSKTFLKIWASLTARTGGLPESITKSSSNLFPINLQLISAAIFIACLFAWNIFIASGINFYSIRSILNFQVNVLGQEIGNNMAHHTGTVSFLQSGTRPQLIGTALGLDFADVSLQGKIFRIFQYFTQLLLIAGCFRLIFSPTEYKFKKAYIALCIISTGMLAACIVLPGFAAILNATRWYHVALITLAPFCVIGAETMWQVCISLVGKIRKLFNKRDPVNSPETYIRYFTILILIPYFIFTSGLIFELTHQDEISKVDTPYSISLSSYRLDIMGIFNQKDGAGAEWVGNYTSKRLPTYTDHHSEKILAIKDYSGVIVSFTGDNNQTANGYFFFSSWNMDKEELAFTVSGKPGLRTHMRFSDIPGYYDLLNSNNRIYVNGGSQVYYLP